MLATQGAELETALAVHNSFRAKYGKDPLPLSYYQTGPQTMYMDTVRKLWINSADRNAEGRVIQDLRHEITQEDLQT